LRYTRFQTTDFDASLPKFAPRLFVMGISGLLVAVLMIGDVVGGLLIECHSARGRQALGLQPGVGGFPHLFDRQVRRGGRFFL